MDELLEYLEVRLARYEEIKKVEAWWLTVAPQRGISKNYRRLQNNYNSTLRYYNAAIGNGVFDTWTRDMLKSGAEALFTFKKLKYMQRPGAKR